MVTSKALSLFDNFNQLTPYAVGYDRVFDQPNDGRVLARRGGLLGREWRDRLSGE